MVRLLAILALAGGALAIPVAQGAGGGLLGGLLGGLPIVGPILGGGLSGGLAVTNNGREMHPVDVVVPVERVEGTVPEAYTEVAREVQKLSQRDVADIEPKLLAVARLLAKVCAAAGVNVKALLANVKISNSNILDKILDNNNIQVGRDVANIDALIKAAVKAFLAAAVNAKVPVAVTLAKIGISYDDILDDVFNWNKISILHSRDGGVADVFALAHAIVKAVAEVCADLNIDVKAIIGKINIKYVKILTDILNNNKISILSRAADPVASVVVDLLALVTVLVHAAAKVNVNVVAQLLNIGIDCSSILDNILNGNNISILRRDLIKGLLPVKALIYALIQVVAHVNAKAALNILNIVIKNSSIGNNILDDNIIKVL